jgi:hypothetical protein
MRIVFVTLVVAGCPSMAAADCPVMIGERRFPAEGGQTFLRVVTDTTGKRAEASLYRLVNAQEQLIWRASLPNVPHDVWVDSGGRWVVTRGTRCDSDGQAHALVVFDARGMLVRDWRRNELVSDEELFRRQTIFLSETPWTASAPLRFEINGATLMVVLPWGDSRVLASAVTR